MDKNKTIYANVIYKMLTELSNRRFGIKEHLIYTEIEKDIKSLVEKYIENSFKLIFNEVTSPEDCIRYEKALSQYLSSILNPDLDPEVIDFDKAFKNSVEINKKEFILDSIEITDDVKSFFKSLKISPNGIETWFKTPNYIRFLNIETYDFLFCTREINTIQGNKILFYILFKDKTNIFKNTYVIGTCLIFNYNKFIDMFSSPLRIFFYIIEEYGLDLTIRAITKKLFYNAKHDFYNNELIHLGNKAGNHRTISMHIDKKTGNAVLFYGLNMEEYFKDYKSGVI